MKIVLKVGLIVLLVMSITALSYAGGTEVSPLKKGAVKAKKVSRGEAKGKSDLLVGPNKKLIRGLKHFLMGWTEIPKSIAATSNASNPIRGITAGTFEGIRKAFPKTISGAADILTFPIGGYDKPAISTAPLKPGK